MLNNSTQLGLALHVLVNLLLPLPLWLFATGFFPYKPILPGQNIARGVDNGHPPPAPFDKLIFMVVDALRSDFVFSQNSAFNHLHGLVGSGAAVPFTAYAAPPTITMPRIKAITTGSQPSFLDAILNFAESDTSSSLSNQDSWPSQMSSMSDGRLVMFGDDTWLKLFPNMFTRSDGTSSFFVSDFTEVDNNVTRHLPVELAKDDWRGMVLHYLGLDHIGHKTGPRSVHMQPKQREMDGIIQTIYEALQSHGHLNSALLVLLGDHGMNDAGNHGGSTAGETSSALVFISPKLKETFHGIQCPVQSIVPYRYFGNVEQSDVVPTLASLLGFPIPLNNLGVLMPDLLGLWPSSSDRLALLNDNMNQISKILLMSNHELKADATGGGCPSDRDEGRSLACMLSRIQALDRDESADVQTKINTRLDFLRNAQKTLSQAATDYNVTRLWMGAIGACVLAALAVTALGALPGQFNLTYCWTGAIACGQTALVFSSSYIEEEQHVWYWLSTGWIAWLYTSASRKGTGLQIAFPVALFCSARVQRRWNQTGQKFSGEPDIGRTFLPQNTTLLMFLVACTYLTVLWELLKSQKLPSGSRPLNIIAEIALVLVAILFKINFTVADSPELLPKLNFIAFKEMSRLPLVLLARFVFGGLCLLLAVFAGRVISSATTEKKGPDDIAYFLLGSLSVLLITQSRMHNIPLFLLLSIDSWLLRRLSLGIDEVSTTLILFQRASFFAFGGSNSMSSIDLSSAYNGVSDFNVMAVGFMVFLSNWVGPIRWTFALTSVLSRAYGGSQVAFLRQTALLSLFNTASLAAVMLSCIMFRSHLFVWTVFSPKYLYSVAWALGQHLLINTALGGIAFWAGSRS